MPKQEAKENFTGNARTGGKGNVSKKANDKGQENATGNTKTEGRENAAGKDKDKGKENIAVKGWRQGECGKNRTGSLWAPLSAEMSSGNTTLHPTKKQVNTGRCVLPLPVGQKLPVKKAGFQDIPENADVGSLLFP